MKNSFAVREKLALACKLLYMEGLIDHGGLVGARVKEGEGDLVLIPYADSISIFITLVPVCRAKVSACCFKARGLLFRFQPSLRPAGGHGSGRRPMRS